MPTYDIGDEVRASVLFTDLSGAPADPTTVRAKLHYPNGAELTYVYGTDDELVKDETGSYYFDFTCETGGKHAVRFVGTGAVQVANETTLIVDESLFANPD